MDKTNQNLKEIIHVHLAICWYIYNVSSRLTPGGKVTCIRHSVANTVILFHIKYEQIMNSVDTLTESATAAGPSELYTLYIAPMFSSVYVICAT